MRRDAILICALNISKTLHASFGRAATSGAVIGPVIGLKSPRLYGILRRGGEELLRFGRFVEEPLWEKGAVGPERADIEFGRLGKDRSPLQIGLTCILQNGRDGIAITVKGEGGREVPT